jgi:signal transduction protein with GAF and PtsI domain
MIDEKKAQEMFGQLTGKAVETMTAWADASQRVLHEMVELGTAGAKESVRLYAELQQSALEALKDSQASALRWPTAWQEHAKDPVQLYQKAVADGVDTAQRVFRAFEAGAQAMTRSAERMQSSAEQAGRGIQESYTAVAARMKDVYAQN